MPDQLESSCDKRINSCCCSCNHFDQSSNHVLTCPSYQSLPLPLPLQSTSISPTFTPSLPSSTNTYQVGELSLRWNERIGSMNDSSHLISNPQNLREVLNRDGFVLLRNYLPTSLISPARTHLIKSLHKDWRSIDLTPPYTLNDAHTLEGTKGVLLTGYRSVTHHSSLLQLVHSNHLIDIMELLTKEKVSTFDTKWVRVIGRRESTDEHSDYYRFNSSPGYSRDNAADELINGSPSGACGMLTCWIPLGNYSISDSTLAVAIGSHLLDQQQYDDHITSTESQELPTSYIQHRDKFHWATSDVRMGDLIIFDIRLIHASTRNEGEFYRLSVDTRWQPTKYVPIEQQELFQHFQQL